MKKWNVQSELTKKEGECDPEELIEVLLKHRGITTPEQKEEFLSPSLSRVTPSSSHLNKKELEKSLKRIDIAKKKKEKVVVYGDYDVDGVTASAILWETLFEAGIDALPYIPHRMEEGYGLSIAGITNLLEEQPEVKLIITVDNGIVAFEAVEFAKEKGIDVIITDHHQETSTLPAAYSFVHTHDLCGAGIAWLFSKEIRETYALSEVPDHLAFAALGTIADLVPLVGNNRAIVKEGLRVLNEIKRPGLWALFQEAALTQGKLGVFEIGYIIAPRLNAMGRLESAMDSLRLLCTKDITKAEKLAQMLGATNRERQELTKGLAKHASLKIKELQKETKKLLFIADATYQQGVIGLIAGKLVEEFYRPAIVLSIGELHTKASVRSVSGVNIIEFLRTYEAEFINIGGHPMAAGFTVETAKLSLLEELIDKLAEEKITDEQLIKVLKVDCELSFASLTPVLYEKLQVLSPFGMGNPEPTFVTRGVEIEDIRVLGKEGKHLKLRLKGTSSPFPLEAICFGMVERFSSLKLGEHIDVLFTLDMNEWNGNRSLQLKVKDMVQSE